MLGVGMPAAKMTLLAAEWIPIDEATKYLGKSAKTVERLVNAEQLRTKLEPREGRKPQRMYHTGDLDRIKQEAIPAPASESRRALTTAKSTEIALSSDTVTTLNDVVTRWLNRPTPPVRITEKLWLTLDEAAELSGLPRSAVADFAAEGELRR